MAFAAPANTSLTASTTYYFVVYTVGSFNLRLDITFLFAEDSGSQAGWSIEDGGYGGSDDAASAGDTWTALAGPAAVNIRVNGSAVFEAPGAPTNLTVTPTLTPMAAGDGTLELSWTASEGTVTAYHVDYTTSATVAAGARAGGQGNHETTQDPARGWVALQRGPHAHRDVTATSFTLHQAAFRTTYRVRVRGSNDGGRKVSSWVHGAGRLVAANAPAAPTGLAAAPGDGRLDLSWTAPAGAVTGYDVHYTSTSASDAVPDAAPTTGNDASAAWVAVNRSGTAVSQEIAGLDNDTDYRVRVRAANASGKGPWAQATGTPKAGRRAAAGRADGPEGDRGRCATGAGVDGALGDGDGLRRALHLGAGGNGREPRGGVGQRSGGRLGRGGAAAARRPRRRSRGSATAATTGCGCGRGTPAATAPGRSARARPARPPPRPSGPPR